MSFLQRTAVDSSNNFRMLSFQTVDASPSDFQSLGGLNFSGDRSTFIPSLQVHPDLGLNYDIGLAANWSPEEQLVLEAGLLE